MPNPFTEERARRSQEQTVDRAPSVSSGGGAYVHTGVSGFVNNLLGLPQASGDVLAMLAGGAEGISALMRGEGANFGERIEQQKGQFPASALRSIPAPTVQELGAGIRSAPSLMPGGEAPGEAFERNLADIEREEAQMRAGHPIATTLGDMSGDAATIVAGRAPLARVRSRAVRAGTPARPPMDPGVKKWLDDIWRSNVVSKTGQFGKQIGEAGIEGATLAALNDGDELDTAIAAGALQAGGSVMSELLAESASLIRSRPVLSLGLSALAAGSAWQLWKSLSPGGRDRILESTETGYDKVAGVLALGSLAALSGFRGPVGGSMQANVPVLADAITSFPRGAALSFIADMTEAEERGDETPILVHEQLMRDPMYFGEQASERLNKAIEEGNYAAELQQLMKRNKFSERVDDLRESRAEQPDSRRGSVSGVIQRGSPGNPFTAERQSRVEAQ